MANRHEKVEQYKPPAPEGADFDHWWAGLTPREQRLETIRDLMVQGRWVRRITSKVLAHQWQLSPHTVESIAAEASRSIKRYATDTPEAREELRQTILQSIEVVRAKCFQNGDSASLRVGLEAIVRFGEYCGLQPPKRIEMSTPDEFDGMSLDQLRAFGYLGEEPPKPPGTGNGSGNGRVH